MQAVAEKMLKPERLLGLLLQKARGEWEKEIQTMHADTEALRAALRASEERHAQHEADLFRQAQVVHAFACVPVSTCEGATTRLRTSLRVTSRRNSRT